MKQFAITILGILLIPAALLAALFYIVGAILVITGSSITSVVEKFLSWLDKNITSKLKS